MSRISFIDFEPDGGEGAGEGGGTGEVSVTEGGAGAQSTEGTGSSFTQADVDRIVQERLARQKAQFKDYDELKTKASEFDKIAEASKSELEKAQERAAKAEADAQAATERAQRVLTDSSILAAAAGKLVDPSDAVTMIDRGAIQYGEDGSPKNIGELVEALVTAKPHLAAQRKVSNVDQGARGGAGPLDDSALMGLGDSDFLKAIGQ